MKFRDMKGNIVEMSWKEYVKMPKNSRLVKIEENVDKETKVIKNGKRKDMAR